MSVCSATSHGSVSKSAMECPFCSKEIQIRSVFNHIRKMHTTDFLKSTSRRWIEEAAKGSPLRLWWSHTNDFDEEVETQIYACLGSNKTFTTEFGGQQHFKKDKAALKEHNKQLGQLKKDFDAMKKAETKRTKLTLKQDPYVLRRQAAFTANDPGLARAIWKGILNHRKTCEIAMMLCKRQCTPETPMYMADPQARLFEQVPFYKLKEYHDQLMVKLDTLRDAKCMDVTLLDKAYIQVLTFWMTDYQESIMGFREEMKELHPLFDHPGFDKFYYYAADEMEGVDF